VFEVLSTDRRIFWAPYLAEFSALIGKTSKLKRVSAVSAVEWDSTKTGYPKDNASHPDGMWKVTLNNALPVALDDTIAIAMTQNFGNTVSVRWKYSWSYRHE
jgi:hypothetical protein